MNNTTPTSILTPEEHRKFLTDLWIHSDQAAIEFSKCANQYLFLLSGAAAAALFARSEDAFHSASWPFIVSSFIVVLTLGLTYVYQTYVTILYDSFLEGKILTNKKKKIVKWIRISLIIAWFFGLGFFIYGAIAIFLAL